MCVRVQKPLLRCIPEHHLPQKPAAVNSISLISSIAMAVGLAASLPQILRMLRTRSSGGQSVLGWGMGLITNLSMAYVNLFGFGAKALMISNLVSGLLCVTAMLLIVRFASIGVGDEAQAYDDLEQTTEIKLRAVPQPVHHDTFVNLPTTELVALSEAVLAARDTRERRSAERTQLGTDLVAQVA